MNAAGHDAHLAEDWLLIILVIVAALPLVAASWQYLLVVAHVRRNHYRACAPCFPRAAVLIPAWNEAAVIGTSIDQLMTLEYPADALRVYVVDDASTDATPQVVADRAARYPGQVFHLRREHGGEGKARTLNHGLDVVLSDDWMQVLLITDADVIFEPDSLRAMTRHLADRDVGAVTAYIKEGSRPGNYLTRFIGYEYVTAQAAARRAQNVLGALACLAGGAQLHTRANLEALGGRIDESSLAEDTITTFETQLDGRRVVFEPHATVWAEEPGTLTGLWKQRLRWARGNVQVTRRYARLWFHPARRHRLGGASFGLFWFCLFLQPIFMITSSAALLTLYFTGLGRVWLAFHVLWVINAVTYAFITGFSLLIDPATARRCWRQAVFFPGAVNLVIIVYSCFPRLFTQGVHAAERGLGMSQSHGVPGWLIVFIYAWLTLSMVVAWLAKCVEQRRVGRVLSPVLIYLVGYGSLLCACTFASYVLELRRAEAHWDKTEKTGKVVVPT